MSAMDHAAAHEQIENLLLDPGRLANLEASRAPEDLALREHVAGCATCRADLEAWRGLGAAISSSLPRAADAAFAATEPADLPPSMRAALLAKAHAVPRSPRSTPTPASSPASASSRAPRSIESAPSRRASRLAPLLAVAAALVVVVGSAFAVVDQASKRQAAEAETAALTNVVSAVDRVLAEPGHVVVQLHEPDGTSAGSISWSRHDWVVITDALARPADGRSYLCWLEENGKATRIGSMSFAGNTAFWVASVDKWATWEITPATRFIVTLQDPAASQPDGATLLEAPLGA